MDATAQLSDSFNLVGNQIMSHFVELPWQMERFASDRGKAK